MNCMAVRYEDEMVVIDAGMGFPEESAYGVDISIPDFEFLEPYRDCFTTLILTHGHEDHIGALPYLLKRFNVPVYLSHFTAGLAERKLEDHDMLEEVLMHRVSPRQKVEIGPFEVEFIRASHSLVDCFSLAIRTPVGTIVHTGDYKIDETPVIGEPTDLARLREYGDEGVLALLGDSTNATVPGRTPSERAVIPAFEEIFRETDGRLIVSTFSSSLHRLQIVLDTAYKYGRKVCVLGRSMQRNVEIADDLGFLDPPDDIFVSLSDAKKMPDDELCLLVTGSQGEMRAALWQLATQVYKGLTIQPNDTVILSARIIPGNERYISRLIGHIYKRGANIIEEKRRLIHVSGHASQEDIQIMTEALRPKFVVPIHGEYRMLFRHKEFVKNHLQGYDEHNVILIENGDVLELDGERASIATRHDIGRTFIDDSGYEEIDGETVRERKKLAYEGVVSLVVTLNAETGELVNEPSVIANGVLGVAGAAGQFLRDSQRVVTEALNRATKDERLDTAWLKESLRIELKRHIQKQCGGARPVILPTVVQI
jgi:ribonuclease J